MNLIFDVGMFIGDDTQYYLSQGFRVVAVEANPLLAAVASKKFEAEIKSGLLVIINKGIAEKKGNFSFWVNETNAQWSSFSKERAVQLSPKVREIKVDTITMDELFRTYGIPTFLKIDIEGMDKLCIRSIDISNKPKYVSCEVGDPEILDLFNAKGYTKYKMINQANGFRPFSSYEELLYVPSFIIKVFWKIRTKLFNRTMSYGSSGPFGENTSGHWKTFKEIKKEFETYYKVDGQPINKLSWYDFHATY